MLVASAVSRRWTPWARAVQLARLPVGYPLCSVAVLALTALPGLVEVGLQRGGGAARGMSLLVIAAGDEAGGAESERGGEQYE